jgi:hypothetical protein
MKLYDSKGELKLVKNIKCVNEFVDLDRMTEEELADYWEKVAEDFLKRKEFEEMSFKKEYLKELNEKDVNANQKLSKIFGGMKPSKSKIQLPTAIVRNEGFNLNALDFVVVAILKYFFYKNNEDARLVIDHKVIMNKLGIRDTRTLKTVFSSLYQNKIILNEVKKLPNRGLIELSLNIEIFKQQEGHFTQLPTRLLDYITILTYTGYRLLYYYQSFINLKTINRHYAFPGFEKICKDLRITDKTLDKYNKHLVKHKMLKIIKHELKEFGYNDDGKLLFHKYQNHYYVRLDNM